MYGLERDDSSTKQKSAANGATTHSTCPRRHRPECSQRAWHVPTCHSLPQIFFLCQRSIARGIVSPPHGSPTTAHSALSESVAAEDPSVLFPLLSAFTLTERSPTPQLAHDTVFTAAADHMHSAALNSARVRLALHALTARLAASAEYYDRHIANLADSDKLHSPECASWVDWYSHIVCDAETLLQLANSQDDDSVVEKPKRLPLDHVRRFSSSPEEPRYTAIHFADPTAPSFHSLHRTLLSLEPKVEYVLRWAQGTTEHEKGQLSSHLSGYGVSLDLKKMDYLVLDDRNQHQASAATQDPSEPVENESRHFSNEELLACIFDSLPYIDEEAKLRALKGEPLTSEEIEGLLCGSTWPEVCTHTCSTDLGAKAIQFIMTFNDRPRIEPLHIHQCWDNHHALPLSGVELFQTLANSFPLYTTSLARKINVSEEVEDEVEDNWVKAAQGVTMAWVNGRVLNENEGNAAGIFGWGSCYTLPTLMAKTTDLASCALCIANVPLSSLLLI